MRKVTQISPQKPIEVVVQLAFYIIQIIITYKVKCIRRGLKKTTSCDYLLADSILLKGVLFQIIYSQVFEKGYSPSHHLPSGQVACFYYNTRNLIRKDIPIVFIIKILFLRLCKYVVDGIHLYINFPHFPLEHN